MDLKELYQEIILDHGKNPRNLGRTENFNKDAKGHNPLCGDKVHVYLKLNENKKVEDISFEGQDDPYYNFYLDWDAFYNNEPHYLKFRQLNFKELVTQSGFKNENLLFTRIPNYPSTSLKEFELSIKNKETLRRDHGNGAVWYTFGGWK